ncbi:hemolysin family protein [Bifidobacterium xylocopae]|uniref:Magnesium/cobalt efflux protein n=1 Tax=Bifidobacterium xylocopae TaxID=2493119 RepID=A0A366KCS3_9BIFI|nr:hemolysin family protein [Bifidobacterium xylocopae]RBP98978.1 magnesium/cobalt efflux protein [Bifidobacterium xylocopae]
MSVELIASAVALGMAALLLVWLSLVMAAAEGAVSRVTKSSLNNLVLGLQTDGELSQFSRMKRIDKVHRVQGLIVDRHATTGSCAFFRVLCNIMTGVLVSSMAGLLRLPVWADLVSGFVFSLLVAVISVKARPRFNGARKPLDIMLRHARAVALAVALTPFARPSKAERGGAGRDDDLSDDEELEKIQIEQGRVMVDQLVEAGAFDPEISEMLNSVLTLSTTLTREIMVPRTDMICIGQETPLASALKLFSRSGFSRIPVIGEDVDDLKGILYLKDVVKAIAFEPEAEDRVAGSMARKAVLVPESKPVDDLFHSMQRTRHHLAIVVDEYGGIAGLVTIEDAIEQIVGELEDEHDRIQHDEPQRIGEHTWKLPARTPIAELEDIFEIDIDEDDVDTVYGLLTKLLGSVPIVGSSAVTRGLKLTAADAAGRRKKIATIIVEPAGGPDQREKTEADGTGLDEAQA